MTFTSKYKIVGNIDFEDIELNTDNKLFVDPYLIYVEHDNFSIECSNSIVNYFEQLLKYAKINDKEKGYSLVSNLQENNEVRFGYSSDIPSGKGLGNNKGKELFDLLCKSKAIKTGLVSDIFDASIMLEKVGYDKISDLTVNIILENLISFTQEQCIKHNVPMTNVRMKRPVWSSKLNLWHNIDKIKLPVHDNKPIILIPKKFARPCLTYTYTSFYNKKMIPYYEREALRDPSSGLVKILKRGIVPAKNKIRKKYPCNKENVVNFIANHPDEYYSYKNDQLNNVN